MTRRTYAYVVVDVFTQKLFTGNQLAVLTDARGLSSEQMQQITVEFNYAESTFVLPPSNSDNDAQVRIFTPGREVPFAGHPNIGTAFVLGRNNNPDVQSSELFSGTRTLRFEEIAGVVAVDVEYSDGVPVYCELTAPEPLSIGHEIDSSDMLAQLASAISVQPDAIITDRHLPCRGSVGLPFFLVEVKDLDTLASSSLRTDLWNDFCQHIDANAVLIYTRQTLDAEVDVRARMYAPKFGVPEDPATGSANCALAGLLAKIDSTSNGELSYRIAQGVEMGRASELLSKVQKRDGEVVSVRIGGGCVMVAEGNINVA